MKPQELLFVPLTKVDVEKREVWGVAAQEVADKSGEIMDYASSKPNFEKWSSEFSKATDGNSLGNVREMHGKSAAGKLTFLKMNDGDKRIEVCAKVVDDQAWKKVTEGVYTGFSIGGSYAKRWQDGDLKRYTAAPSEVSLVDNPCIPTATFTMVKADGLTEEVPFIVPAKKAQPMKKNLAKGMYGVAQLAQMIEALQYVQRDSKFEAEYEGDGSEVPKKLQSVVDTLGAILVQMAQEEVDELIPKSPEEEMTESEKLANVADMLKGIVEAETLSKATGGERHSAKDMKSIQAIHDNAAKLGAKHNGVHDDELKADGYTKADAGETASGKGKDEDAEKAAKAVELAKAEAAKKDESADLIKALIERISKLEAQPAAPAGAKPVAFSFGKTADTSVTKTTETKGDSALDLMKAAHSNGHPLSKEEAVTVAPSAFARI